nr:hypothetical protein [Tanacetum cinerariifolium]
MERSGEERVVAKCGQRPPRVSAPEKVDEHTCVTNFNFGALVNYKWIAKIFGDEIMANPNIKLCDIADLVMKKYKCKVSLNQCVNAKRYALTEYEKSIGEHYGMLRSYGKAILDSNTGSTVKLGVTVNPDGKTYFDRFYVCFARLADRWKAGCRKIIAFDGCFLNSPNQGEILTAIGRDEDLGCSRGNGLTLMSNQHKEMEPWGMSQHQKEIGMAEGPTKVRSGSERFTVDEGKRTCSCRIWQLSRLPCVYATKSMYSTALPPEPRKIPGRPKKKRIRAIVEQTPKPKGVPGRPRKKESVNDLKDVDVHRGPVRDEGASKTRGCTIGSRGKKVVGTSGFAKWFGLQDGPEHTQAEAQQTQQKPEQTQVEDQVEQTEDQAEIDLTQVEKTQEQTQEQLQPQEQPQQAALRMPSARILQRKLGKQGNSQNTALNLD